MVIVLPSTAAVSEQDRFRAHSVMMTHTHGKEKEHTKRRQAQVQVSKEFKFY